MAKPMTLARFACGASIADMVLSLKIKPFVSFLVAYQSCNILVSQAMRSDFTCAHIQGGAERTDVFEKFTK